MVNSNAESRLPSELNHSTSCRLHTIGSKFEIIYALYTILELRQAVLSSSNLLTVNYISNESSFSPLSNGIEEYDRIFFFRFVQTIMFTRIYHLRKFMTKIHSCVTREAEIYFRSSPIR